MTRRVAAVVEQCWHQVPGGTATSTVRTLEGIQAAGEWSVAGIAAFHRGPASPMATPTVSVTHLRLGRRVLYEAWHRFRRPALPRSVGAVDVVHATGGVIPPTGGVPLVVTVNDLAFLHRPEHFTTHGVRFMTRSFELAKAEAAAVIVPSEVTAEDCCAHGLDAERIHVVPLGVIAQAVTEADRSRVRATYNLPESFVLWLGAAEPRKNLDRLVAAMDTNPDVALVLAGSPGWGVDVERLVSASPNVRHIGAVPDADLAPLYDAATVFVFPSLLEGFGMPVLEAMAQGTPVITSAGTATAEVAGEAARLINPMSEEEIGTAIRELLVDPIQQMAMIERGRRQASALSWAKTAAATTAVYESVLR